MKASSVYRMRLRKAKVKGTNMTLEDLLSNVIEICEKITNGDEKEFTVCVDDILGTALRKLREVS